MAVIDRTEKRQGWKTGLLAMGRIRKNKFIRDMLRQWDLQLLVLPSIVAVFIFSYIPIYGLLMAFQQYNIGDIPGFSQWVGLKQFNYLIKDPNFPMVMRNTLAISALKILVNFPLPIIFAVMLNELRLLRVRKLMQTISYLPHFISWVVAATLLFDFFSTDYSGAVNNVLMSLGLVDVPVPFFGKGEYFWPMAVFSDLWKELGWGSIIYFAAITSVDMDQYEAASIDGAGRARRIWHITLAGIRPTIVLLFIFTIGGMLEANFDQIMMLTKQMTNPMLREYAEVIDTYVYSVGIRGARYSYAEAASLFKTLINFMLLLGANFIAGRLGESALF